MEFDKSRVYTALNADELKVGSKVIVADNISLLKSSLEERNVQTLESIRDESYACRFINNKNIPFLFAYLVEEPEEKKLKWTDLKIGDVLREKTRDIECMVTLIDRGDTYLHIFAGEWIRDNFLEDWEKVENKEE